MGVSLDRYALYRWHVDLRRIELIVRAGDWFAQADRDLAHAEDSQEGGSHEWACFAGHQSAEKAVGALHLHLGQESCGMFPMAS